jgi:siroheme synthase-like protein
MPLTLWSLALRKLSINLDLLGRKVLLIGCGKVGKRKLSYLLGTGASITVVEPYPDDYVLGLFEKGEINLVSDFTESLLAGKNSSFSFPPLVFVSTELKVATSIISTLKDRNIWYNVASTNDEGNFTLPAVVEDGSFKLTITTDGASPALSAKIAKSLRKEFKGYGSYTRVLGDLRPLILNSSLSPEERREKFINLGENEDLPRLLNEKKFKEAKSLLDSILSPLSLPLDFKFKD